MKRQALRARFVLVTFLAIGCGCIPLPGRNTRTTGQGLPLRSVEAVVPGAPLREVLARLGPPTAVARRGTVVELPRYPGRLEGSREVAADALFSRFPGSPSAGARDAVYVFEASRLERTTRFVSYYSIRGHLGDGRGVDSDRITTDRLLLLVDGERRVVAAKLVEQETTVLPPSRKGAPGSARGRRSITQPKEAR
jgi:hypothetical protein